MRLIDNILFYIYRYRVLSPEQLRVLIAYDKGGADPESPAIKALCTRSLRKLVDAELIRVMDDPVGHPKLPCPKSYVPTKAGAYQSRKMMEDSDKAREIAARLPARAYRPPLSPAFYPHQYYLNEFLTRFNTALTYNIAGSVCWNDNFVLPRQDLRPDACVYLPPSHGLPKTYFFIENDMTTMSSLQNRDKFEEYAFLFHSFFYDPTARYVFLFLCNDMSYEELADRQKYDSHIMHRQTRRRIDRIRRELADALWTYMLPCKHVDMYADNYQGIMKVVRRVYLPQYELGGSPIRPLQIRRDASACSVRERLTIDYRLCFLNGVRTAYDAVRRGAEVHIRCTGEREVMRFWRSFGDYFDGFQDKIIFEF